MISVLRLGAAALVLSASTALAQATTEGEDHELHHPTGETAAPAAPAASPCAPRMMGGGMMGGMNPGSMVGRGPTTPGKGMADGGMMGQGGSGPGPGMEGGTMGGMMAGMTPFADLDARLEALGGEVAVTDAQRPAWNGFVEAMRAYAGTHRRMHDAMMAATPPEAGAAPPTWPARLEARAAMMREAGGAAAAIAAALDPLYAALSDRQRAAAETGLGCVLKPM